MSTISCQTCGKEYQLIPGMAGKRVRCKACNNVFTVPSDDDDPLGLGDLPLESATESSPLASPWSTPARSPQSSAAPVGWAGARQRTADEIDYEIFGQEMQYCEITLDPGEMVIADAGAMMYMSAAIQMNTVFGDPSAQQKQGFWGTIASAGKRAITGESLFMTTFTNLGSSREIVAFAAPYPGKIIPLHLDELGGEIVCQKGAFLCGARGIQLGIAFQKKIGVGLFGGEGFIMQRLTGDGIAMVHAGGSLMHRELRAGETLKLDTGCLMALSPSVRYNIEFVGGLKNTFFGGEGLFLATLTGPGRIWCQSLPFSRLAGRMMANASRSSGKGEGSLLDSLGGLGGMLMGD